jgi:hypothetical protein
MLWSKIKPQKVAFDIFKHDLSEVLKVDSHVLDLARKEEEEEEAKRQKQKRKDNPSDGSSSLSNISELTEDEAENPKKKREEVKLAKL